MKKRFMVLLLVAGGSLFAETHFSIGVQVGAPRYYSGPAVVAYRPPCPGPGYIWVPGYYNNYGNWFNGYWATPPYAGAYWVAPRFYQGRSYPGYWGGARGHEWREHGRGHGYGRGYR